MTAPTTWVYCRRCKNVREFATLAEAETYLQFANRCHGEPDVARIIDEAVALASVQTPQQIHRLMVLG